MGKAKFRPPPLQNPYTNFDVVSIALYYSPQGVDMQNLVWTHSAVTDLRMREKSRFSSVLVSETTTFLLVTVPTIRRF